MKRIIVISLIALLPVLAGCNTVQGVGKDITAVGKGMENATK
jgi:predicted small secreted protein